MANLSIKQVLTNLGKDILNWVKSNCVNNLLSDRTDLPLSAAQGKALDGKITALNSNIATKNIFYEGNCGDDTLTVSDMSQYGTIHLMLKLGNAMLMHNEIPYQVFKRQAILRCGYYDGSHFYSQDVTYVNETTVQVLANTNAVTNNLSFIFYGSI